MQKNTKKFLGWSVLILIILTPVLLWFLFGDGDGFTNYADTVHSLGELFGLVGMTIFAITFVLSTRISWIEDVFGGLDKVYIVHGLLGGTALLFILAHPIFLVLKFIPGNFPLAASYLLPSSYWSVNLGIIALFGILGLIYITLYTKIKYHKWKFTHEFLGLVFLIAVFHIFLVRGTVSQGIIFHGYYVYATIVSVIGLWAFSYSLFLKNRKMKNAIYKIKNIIHKDDVFEIEMMPEHKPIEYHSGQFIFVRFYNEKLSEEPHPFSISSKSNSEFIKIVVRKLGDFTSSLEHLKVGDKVSIEGPYGRFNFKNYSHKNQIWLASGIGIVPFIGMAEDLSSEFQIDLYYVEKNENKFIGNSTLREIEKRNKNFKFIPWTSEKMNRLDVHKIKKLSRTIENKEFLICGSPGFKEEITKQLINEGVKKSNIHEEVFDFR